jgi:hypothetical protein
METGIPGGMGHLSQNDPRARSDGAPELGFEEHADFPNSPPNPENGEPLEP